MEWVPTERLAMGKTAVPPTSVALPSVMAPSKKVTVPVAAEGETVAVKVTVCP